MGHNVKPVQRRPWLAYEAMQTKFAGAFRLPIRRRR